jgi:hypothetical protein
MNLNLLYCFLGIKKHNTFGIHKCRITSESRKILLIKIPHKLKEKVFMLENKLKFTIFATFLTASGCATIKAPQTTVPQVSGIAAHFDSNAPHPDYTGSVSGKSWSYPQPQTMFYCFALDAKKKPLINGIEFSFRDTSKESQKGACGNLSLSAYKAISGKEVSVSNNHDYQGNIQYLIGENDDYPFELISFYSLPGNEKLGWYRANSKTGFNALGKGSIFSQHKHGFFSEGVFGQPLDGIPKTGVANYDGTVSEPTHIGGYPEYVKNINIAKVDFSKSKIDIDIKMTNRIGINVFINTVQPMTFNKEDGAFKGEVRIQESSSMGFSQRTAIINGFLGGKNASVVYGLFSEGDAFNDEGIDFVLGAKR